MKRKYEIKNNKKPTTKHKCECLHVLHVGATAHSTFDSVVIMEKKNPKNSHTGSANVFIDLSPHASCDRVMQNGGLNGD